MIYLNADFKSNFDNSVKSGDTDLTTDIFVNEIADVIVYDYEKVIDLLNKVGIRASKRDTDEQLVNKILTNLPNKEKLSKGLAFLLAENNKVLDDEAKNQADLKKEIDKVADGINVVAQQIEIKKQYQTQLQDEIVEAIKVRADKMGDRKRVIQRPDRRVMKSVIIVALLIGGGYLLYANWDKIFKGGSNVEVKG